MVQDTIEMFLHRQSYEGGMAMQIKELWENEIFPSHTQVLIVGGGPVGLSAAMELGLRGIDCVVVEPTREVSHLRPRAKTTNVRTMEHFRRWNIAQQIRTAAPLSVSWSQEVSFCGTLLGKEITRIGEVFGLKVTLDERFAEAGQQIPQFVVEEVLRKSVATLPSVRFVMGWTFEALTQDDKKVTAHLVSDRKEHVTIETEFLIGCDGARSAVRKEIGIVYEGNVDSMPNFNILFRSVELAKRVPHDPAVQYWILNQEAPGLMGRLDLNDIWWMIVLGVDAEKGNTDPGKYIRGQLGGEVPLQVISTDEWSARMLLASRYRVGRVFLAGDAAHLNPPWGGHGFNTGIGDAVDIGWKLAAVLQGWGGPQLLDSYEAERRPISARVIKTASDNMKTLSSDLASERQEQEDEDTHYQKLAESIHKTKKMEFHSLGLVLGYRYDQSHVIIDDGTDWPAEEVIEYCPTAHPGARLPHAWLHEDRSVYDELGAGFTLLRLDSSVQVDELVKAAEQKNVPLKVVTLDNSELLNLYEQPLLLVRPDQHVAWRGIELPRNSSELLNRVSGW
jgi:2-polyprenyl-6-methoxyphenol hydroxylase-like FAD-dependent oxidoreductase